MTTEYGPRIIIAPGAADPALVLRAPKGGSIVDLIQYQDETGTTITAPGLADIISAEKRGDRRPKYYDPTATSLTAALAYVGPYGRVSVAPDPSVGITLTTPITVPFATTLNLGTGATYFDALGQIRLSGGSKLNGSGHEGTYLEPLAGYAGVDGLVLNYPQDNSVQSIGGISNLKIIGNKGGGAVCPLGISGVGLGQPSYIRDVVVVDLTGTAILSQSFFIMNVWTLNCDDHHIKVFGGGWCGAINLTCERINDNKAGLYCTDVPGALTTSQIWVLGFHCERLDNSGLGTVNSMGIWLENVNGCSIRQAIYAGSGAAGDLIRISGAAADSHDNLIEQVFGKWGLINAINDQTYGVKRTGFVDRYVSAAARTGSRATPTYGAAVTVNATDSSWQTVVATNGVAFAISVTNTPLSTSTHDLTVEIHNNSGGALGAITWNAPLTLTGGAFVAPATGFKRWVRFGWNGNKYVEMARGTIDYA